MCECTFTERLFCHVWFSHGTSQGPTNCCFCCKLPSGSVSVGFEAAIWHLRRVTTCFYWASKLPSGTFPAALKPLKPPSSFAMGLSEAPRPVSVGNCHLAAFLLASKLLSGISEAPQLVSIGLRNCHPARFQQLLKP